MDTVRTSKSNKRNWIIAGSLIAVLFVIFVVICVSITGGDSVEETEEETKTTVKNVPEAFEYIEGQVDKNLGKKDPEKKELLGELKETKGKVTTALETKKAEDAKSKDKSAGRTVTVKVSQESTESHSLPVIGSEKEVSESDTKGPSSYTGPGVVVKVTDGKDAVVETVAEPEAEGESKYYTMGQEGTSDPEKLEKLSKLRGQRPNTVTEGSGPSTSDPEATVTAPKDAPTTA